VIDAASTLVERELVYCQYPSLNLSDESRAAWLAMLDSKQPTLIVVDAMTEVLADAALNENHGTDIARWINGYIQPALERGISCVMLDHVGHSDDSRPISSQHKGAAARGELQFKVGKKPTREKVGTVVVKVMKNSYDANLLDGKKERTYRIGGSPFVFEVAADKSIPEMLEELNTAGARARIRPALLEEITRHPGQTKQHVMDGVSGRKQYLEEELRFLVETGQVERREGSRAGTWCYYIANSVLVPHPTT
jgi:hypothetical protein